MDLETVRAWLKEIRKDREWLGQQCGVSKRTVDNWFAAGALPPHALITIERLRAESLRPQMRLSEDEWELIDRAREAAGFANRQEFYRAVLLEKAAQLLEEGQKAAGGGASDPARSEQAAS